MIRFETILETIEAYKPDFDEDLLQRAYVYSAMCHKGQTRRSGEPYLIHPLAVSQILAEMRLDEVSIAVGLLHDVLEDTLATKEELTSMFGEEVADLVDGVTKISRYAYVSREQQQAETFRKMVLAMVSDLRVILIKLADRLHNMRTLDHLSEDRRHRIAKETMEIYAPIANRLGMGKIKTELEDTSLRYLNPREYEEIRRGVEEKQTLSRAGVKATLDEIENQLSTSGVDAEVSGRVKSINSIHQKLLRQGIPMAELFDYVAFRIVTKDIAACYGALGVIHQRWRPVPGRIKDYIAIPKPNFYQSLHTTVVGDGGVPFEVQIRTEEMDIIAEQGVAAHWKYKEGRIGSTDDDESFQWLRQLVELQQEVSDPQAFMSSLRIDLYPDEVYTFTPKGDVHAFPRGATVLDFAYRIHTDVGHRCVGVRVNGKLMPLKTKLQNGDIVDVVTGPHQTPSREWLNLVVTSRARHKIRNWLNTEQKKHSMQLGKRLLEKETRRFRLQLKKLDADGTLAKFASGRGLARVEDLYADIGYGKISARAVVEAVSPESRPTEVEEGTLEKAVRKLLPFGPRTIKVSGHDDLMTYLARCCSPLPGESIVGYVSRGKGVAVHSSSCPNVQAMMFNADRGIDVEWGDPGKGKFGVQLECLLHPGAESIGKALKSLGELKINFLQVEARTDNGSGRIDLGVEITDRRELERLMKSISGIESVARVERRYQVRGSSPA